MGLSFKIFLLFVFLVPVTAFADILVLSNGDVLTGKVAEFSKGQLKLETEYAGEIKIDWNSISSIDTEESFFIYLKEDHSIRAKIIGGPGGWILIDDRGETYPVARSDIKDFFLQRPKKWTLQFDLGYQKTSGNSASSDLRTGIKSKMKRKRDDLLLAASYARGETENQVSVDRWDLQSKYNHLLNKKVYGSVFFFLERDRVRDINRRWQVGPGIGCRFYETGKFSISSDISAIWEKTKYEPGGSESKLKGLWGVDFSYVPIGNIKIEETFRWVQSSTQGSDYEITSETGVYIPVYDNLFLKASLINLYDNKPQPGLKKNDFTFLTSLSYVTNF